MVALRTRGFLAVALVLAGCAAGQPAEVSGVVLESDDDTEPDAAALALPAGPGAPGVAMGFGDGDTATSSTVLESEPSPLVSDIVPSDDLEDRVHCATRLQAPADRDLVASGHLDVTLVLERRDGTVERQPAQVVPVDARVAAGDRMHVAAGPEFEFDRDEVAGLHCEVRFDPA